MPGFPFQLSTEQKIILISIGLVLLLGMVFSFWHQHSADTPALLVSQPETEIQFQVQGEVLNPGIYRAKAPVRGWEALRAAGGVLPGAELSAINLAETVKDGQRIFIPPKTAKPDQKDNQGEKLAVNQASAEELEKVPGVGPVTVQKIIELRNKIGGFHSWKDLEKVPRLGKKRVERLKEYLTLD